VSEMIERVAKAIAKHEGAIIDDKDWNGPLLADRGRVMFRAVAKVAIEAMREPTIEMVESIDIEGETDAGGGINATYSIGSEEAKKVWQAMIDAALDNGK
jgi:hypothetical protein